MVGPVCTTLTRLMRFVEVLPDAALSAAASARASAAAFLACGLRSRIVRPGFLNAPMVSELLVRSCAR